MSGAHDSSGSPAAPDRNGMRLTWPEESIALVTLDRPEVRNAVAPRLADELCATFTKLGTTDACRAIILTGAGAAFCAGADLTRAPSAEPGARQQVQIGAPDRYVNVIRAFRSCPVPIIAAVNGSAVGFGMALALAADVRLMSSSARFAVGAIKIGLSAGESGISWHLPRLIGMSRAMDLMLTGRIMESAEANACGLAALVDDLDAGSLATANAIAANSLPAVRMTKQLAWANLESSLSAALELENRTQSLASTTSEFRDAVRRFTEKRAR